ncbi:hypothetical protein [Rhizobium sp. ZPR3]|uniref:Transposase n=2 Tax=unclassified Rhizobium TaxID=2613769 RepID=A0AAU7SBF3_9HYPH
MQLERHQFETEMLQDFLIRLACLHRRYRCGSIGCFKSFLKETKKAALKLPPWTPIYGSVMQPMGAGALESEPFGPSISWKQR